MRIRTKLGLGFGALTALLIVAALESTLQINRIADNAIMLAEVRGPQQEAILELEVNLHKTGQAILDYMTDLEGRGTPAADRILDSANDFTRFAGIFERLATGEKQRQLVTDIERLYGVFQALGRELTALADTQLADKRRLQASVSEIIALIDDELDKDIDDRDRHAVTKFRAALGLKAEGMETLAAVRAYLTLPDAARRDEIREEAAKFARFVDLYRSARPSPAELGWIDALQRHFAAATAAGADLMSRADEMRRIRGRLQNALDELDSRLDDELQPLVNRAVQETAAETKKSVTSATRFLLVLALLGAGVALGGGIHLVKGISLPLGRLAQAAAEIGKGNLDTTVDVGSDDELGALAAAINQMSADLRSTTVSRGYLVGILESMTTSLAVVNVDGTVRKVNPATLRLTGFSEDELVGQPARLFMRDDLFAGADLAEQIAMAPLVDREAVYRRKDGTDVVVLLSASPMRDAAGTLDGIVVGALDFTERRRLAEAARRSEQRFKDFAEIGSDWLWEIDETLRFTFMSERFFEVTGVRTEDVLGKTWWEMTGAEEDDEIWVRRREELVSHTPLRNFRYSTIEKGGRQRYWKISGDPVFDESGAFKGYRGATSDESAEFETRFLVAKAEARLREAIESVSEGFALFGRNDRLALSNKKYRELFGAAADLVEPDVPFETLCRAMAEHELVDGARPGDEAWIKERLERHRKPGSFQETCRADGRCYQVSQRRTREGGIVCLHTDITDVKLAEDEKLELERRLRQSHKMEALGTLAGGIAHDFNNVLVPMLGLTKLTMRTLPADGLGYGNLQKVLEAGNRAKFLVAQILAFSREKRPERQPIALYDVVNEAMGLLRSTTPATIEIRHDLYADVGVIMAEPTEIHQVLMNLATNAAHAMQDKGGVLTVTLARVTADAALTARHPTLQPGDYVRIAVQDTGCGMDPQTMSRIFDPFFTTKSVGEGTGMGLAVAHGIVSAHGGAIAVSSTVGKGSTFELYFPQYEAAAYDGEPELSAAAGPIAAAI